MEFIKQFDKTAIVYEGRKYSYKELISYSKEYAELLEIEKEDNVVIFMENRPELFFAFLGTWHKKGTCVCLDAASKTKEFQYFIEDATPKYIFASNQNIDIVKEAIELSEKDFKDTKIINVDEVKLSAELKYNGIIMAPDRDAVSLILYTSGTTGNPKGVMLTFDNILVNIEGLNEYNMFLESDRVLALLPMHHIFPLLGSGIVPLAKGETLTFIKEMSSQAMMAALKDNKITMMIGVPRLWEMLHKKIMEKINSSKVTRFLFDFCAKRNSMSLSRKVFKKVHEGFGGHIRFFVSGGSKLNPEIAKDLKVLGIDICEGYGLTETAPMISFTPIGKVVPGSAGKIMSGTEAMIAEDGEILARGRNVMKGYYKNPEATSEVIDEDGWFHTGDLGEIKDGYLYVTGRKKEMIVLSNGKNINPIEIEQKLMNMTTAIEEIVVLEYNSLLTAAVYPNKEEVAKLNIENIGETLKTLVDKYNADAPNYKKILDIKVLDTDLPKTKIGKIRRFMVPAVLDGTIVEEVVEEKAPEFKEYQEVAEFLTNLKGKKVTSKAHLEMDLGLDSLDLVELAAFVQNSYGVILTEEIVAENGTVIQIAEFVKENSSEGAVKESDWGSILKVDRTEGLPKGNCVGRIIRGILSIPFKTFIKINNTTEMELKITKPTIFIGNHQSFLDGFILQQAISKEIVDNTCAVAKVAHFKNPIFKYIGKNSNVILIDVNSKLTETLQAIATTLRQGKNILIFPEGTRTKDGKIKNFKKFYAILAKELNADIVSFGIKGAFDLYPPHKKLPKSGTVEFKILDKISTENKTVEEIMGYNHELIKNWLEK